MKITILFLILLSSSLKANEVLSLKENLAQEIKVLLKANQEIYPLELPEKKTSFLIGILNNAYALSSYECLYGGWPSRTIKVNGKYYCSDAKKSDFYQHSYACKKSEFTCPEVLFGKDVCVAYGTRANKLAAYNNCESKQKPIQINSDFNGRDHQMLVEYIKIADEICNADDKKKNIVKVNCEKIKNVSTEYEKKFIEIKKLRTNESDLKKTRKIQSEDCIDCEGKSKTSQKEIIKLTQMTPKIIYQQLKDDFRKSKLCNPIHNYPPKDRLAIAFLAINKVQDSCSRWGKDQNSLKVQCDYQVEKLASLIVPNEAVEREWNQFQNQIYNGDDMGSYKLLLSMKKYVMESNNDNKINALAQEAFYNHNVLSEDEESGEPTCPFPSFDAFNKAYTGYQKLKNKLGKDVLTIVDYTMPSNHRRMFSFDMKNLETISNTWVAHGSGSGGVAERDGSNPIVSNENGSNLSSEGFIIARNAARGNMFGDNILLDGVDENNGNMRRREIVLHGDSMAGNNYKALSFNQEMYEEKMSKIQNTNLNSDAVSIRTAATAPGQAYPMISETWGCLGVPDHPALNIKTGKYESQLQTLRTNLSGNTLIFNYTGENMRSRYF